MLKAVIFDFGHTIMNELEHRDIFVADRPVVLMSGVIETLPLVNFKMGIWNNTKQATEHDVRKWLERASINQYFSWVVTSFDVGHRKPSREFFDLALEKCNLSKDEVVFVGNQLNSDIKGANDYGIISIYIADESFRSPDETESLDTVKPNYVIKKLTDLPNLLSSLS